MWIWKLVLLAALLATTDGVAQDAAARTERELARLLGRELSAEAVDDNGWTDLHFAAALNLPTLAARLLDAGAAPSGRLHHDHEPLSDRLRSVLTSLGQDTYGNVARYGQTPLLLAIRAGSVRVAELLLDRGADVHESDLTADGADDYSALHYAALFSVRDAARLLIARGAEVQARTANGRTPLHSAAQKNAVKVAAILIANGADLDARGNSGWAPLHVAAAANAHETAHLLILHGADVNAQSKTGHTPLHSAAEYDAAEAASLLLASGADVTIKTAKDLTPLHVAAATDAVEVAQVLIANGALVWEPGESISTQPLAYAMSHDARNTAKLLVNLPFDDDQETILHFTAFRGHLESARRLIDFGANVRAKDEAGNTPLHHLMKSENLSPDLAKLLIDSGAGVNARNESGDTPLHHLIESENLSPDLVKLLIDRGAGVNARNKFGTTPLDTAISREMTELATLLIEEGAAATERIEHLMSTRLARALCRQYQKNDFFGMLRILKNYSLRLLGRELTLEEVWPYIDCKVKSISGLDLFQSSFEDVSLDGAFENLVEYFARKVEDKNLLGNILSCKEQIGRNFYLNTFEYLEYSIRESGSDETIRQARREMLQILDDHFPSGRPQCDREFCRQYLGERYKC